MWGDFVDNSVLIALIWMILANVAAVGPNRFKVAALVVMLISAGAIIPAVVQSAGWLIGVPIMALMFLQMRWAFVIIWRLVSR